MDTTDGPTVEDSQARYRKIVTDRLKPTLTVWKTYKNAKADVEAEYDGLRTEKTANWNARILRLIEAREVALESVELYQSLAQQLAVALQEHQQEVPEDEWLSLADVAREEGINIGDLDPGNSPRDKYRPQFRWNLKCIIDKQDARLAEVKRLSPW